MKAKLTLESGGLSFTGMGVTLRKGKPSITDDPKAITYFQKQRGVRVDIIPEKGRPPKEVAAARDAERATQDEEEKARKKKARKLVKKDR